MRYIEFPYIHKESRIFGKILRPLIHFEVFSNLKREWIFIDEALADSGADITILPRFIGEMVMDDITSGKYIEIRGIVPTVVLVAFIHQLKIKIGVEKFKLPVAIAESNAVPPILGRMKGLDKFEVSFVKGKKVKFRNYGTKQKNNFQLQI